MISGVRRTRVGPYGKPHSHVSGATFSVRKGGKATKARDNRPHHPASCGLCIVPFILDVSLDIPLFGIFSALVGEKCQCREVLVWRVTIVYDVTYTPRPSPVHVRRIAMTRACPISKMTTISQVPRGEDASLARGDQESCQADAYIELGILREFCFVGPGGLSSLHYIDA